MKAFDVATDTTGQAHAIKAAGYGAVGLYLRPDRASIAMVEGLHSVGIKVWSIFEKGIPTHAAYFSETQGKTDSIDAVAFAVEIGQPKGTPIFFCVDYDAASDELATVIRQYFQAVHSYCKSKNYLVGVYGSGLTCSKLIAEGIAHYGYLAGSKGFSGYEAYLEHAAIVQGDETATVCGFGVDLDEVRNPAVVCW